MKIIYIAEDGTQFNDEDACREYEIKQKVLPIIKANVTGYTRRGKIVPLDDDLESWYNTSDFIIVNKDMTDDEINYWQHEMGLLIPTRKGIYRYNFSKWTSYSEEKATFESNWGTMMKIIEQF